MHNRFFIKFAQQDIDNYKMKLQQEFNTKIGECIYAVPTGPAIGGLLSIEYGLNTGLLISLGIEIYIALSTIKVIDEFSQRVRLLEEDVTSLLNDGLMGDNQFAQILLEGQQGKYIFHHVKGLPVNESSKAKETMISFEKDEKNVLGTEAIEKLLASLIHNEAKNKIYAAGYLTQHFFSISKKLNNLSYVTELVNEPKRKKF